jgi:tetratricopeptide (TPR) repeat protein
MPYFGGATLAQLLQAMRSHPPAQRTGQSLLDALNHVQAAARVDAQATGPARQILAGASYVQALCWVGARLADALHYAHERSLVHLDLKPSNVLLAADGQPMLLDFHLAREPLHAGGRTPTLLGGTGGYMSPEQQAALLAIEQGRNVALPVDGRSDIFSLGVVLYEALGGPLPVAVKPRPLHLCNSQVSVGLADVVSKCLAADPGDRYPHMAAVATDLRRHLAHLPLAGVRNRSVVERWRKWRHRQPQGVALTAMILAVLTAAGAIAIGVANHLTQRITEAGMALEAGRSEMDSKEWGRAVSTLQHGLRVARGIPFRGDLADQLDSRLRLAEREQAAAKRAAAARELHLLSNRIRFLYGAEHFSHGGLRGLEASCRAFWENRIWIVANLRPDGAAALEPPVRDDLLDMAIFCAHMQQRLAPPGGKEQAGRKALAILDEAEALLGASPVLDEERKLEGAADRQTDPSARASGPQPETTATTPLGHYARGRASLLSGDLERAARELEQAVYLQPQGLWPNFYQGLCAYRMGRYLDAVAAYSVCIGAAPEPAGCFYNRALAYEGLGRTEQALQDYDQALRLDPALAVAALNRGMLHYRQKRYAAAISDLQRARELGAAPVVVAFDLALAHLARGEHAAALNNLGQALSYNPHQSDARKLYDSLRAR